MLIRNENINSECKLGVWKITETSEELLSFFPDALRQRAAQHVSRMRTERRIVEWLSARLMVYLLLNEEKIIHHHRNGQPFLTDHSHNISITHTNNYVAILIHKTRRVGIDAEFRSDRVGRIAYKFISPDEYITEHDKSLHQLLHWSAKETMFKLLDENEVDFREHLRLHPFEPQISGVMKATESKTPQKQTFEIAYEVYPDYVLTWAIGDSVS